MVWLGDNLVALLALVIGSVSLIWHIRRDRRERKEKRLAEGDTVTTRAVYNPAMSATVTDHTKSPDVTYIEHQPWCLQLYVTNSSRHELYLAPPCLHYKTANSLTELAFTCGEGKGNPVAPGDQRYFYVSGKKDDRSLPDIAKLPRHDVEITISTHEKLICRVPGKEIVWIGVLPRDQAAKLADQAKQREADRRSKDTLDPLVGPNDGP